LTALLFGIPPARPAPPPDVTVLAEWDSLDATVERIARAATSRAKGAGAGAVGAQ
jgi:hypothetical protein